MLSDRQRCSTRGSFGSWCTPTRWFCCRWSILHLAREQEAELCTTGRPERPEPEPELRALSPASYSFNSNFSTRRTVVGRLLWCILGACLQPWQAYRTQVREPIRDQLQLLHADESAQDAQEIVTLKGVPQVLVGQVQLLWTQVEPSECPLHTLEVDLSTDLPDSFPSSLAVSAPNSVLHPPSSSSSPIGCLPCLFHPPMVLLNDKIKNITVVPSSIAQTSSSWSCSCVCVSPSLTLGQVSWSPVTSQSSRCCQEMKRQRQEGS